MPRGNDRSNEKDEKGEATEGGFGTGLRAQLEKRRGDQPEEQPEPQQEQQQEEQPETPLVRVDLDTSLPPQDTPDLTGELERLRKQLTEAQKREREVRA